ncbi:MAG TPA: hypothetical protein VFB38_05235 [Chthonomonadaceae bacterium]|nr:hypothetical protein [Chthonomonadaceae bacterium]
MLGTRRIWKSAAGTDDAAAHQIRKMSGYVSIVLQAAQYHTSGNWWQRRFGGSDRITLKSEVIHQHGNNPVTAATIQDTSRIRVGHPFHLPIGRNIAVKLPADADGLELRAEIAAIQSDGLQAALDMLNSDEFRKPLQLAPAALGEIVTVTRLVKKLFSGDAATKRLEATYSGILSQGPDANGGAPATGAAAPNSAGAGNALCSGWLILISASDDNDRLDQIEDTKLTVEGDQLRYDGKSVPYTYVIYRISLDPHRGVNSQATWCHRYREALSKLDKLYIAGTKRKGQIKGEALNLWGQGNALLETDPEYLASERDKIKKDYLSQILKRYQDRLEELSGPAFGGNTRIGSLLPPGMAASVNFADLRLVDVTGEAEQYRKALQQEGLEMGL